MLNDNKFILPNELKINNYIYKLKDSLANDYFLFRCKHRVKCKLLIKINKDELIKYANDSSYNINFIITDSEIENKINNDSNDNKEDINLKVINYKELAKNLIFNNIE